MEDSESSCRIWENIADFWDAHIGEGNDFQRKLIMPATDRLLGPVENQTILDIACGNGNYARQLGRRRARVVAIDFCQTFLDHAKTRTKSTDRDIQYQRVDATDFNAMKSLGPARFDAAVCSMALMDMASIEPVFLAVKYLLKPGGRFVFSLPHPCFNSNQMRFTSELILDGQTRRQMFGIQINAYLTPREEKSWGIVNQPEPHLFFHRPLSAVLNAAFAAGFVVDAMEEPAFDGEGRNAKNPFSWAKRPDIPPAMLIRVRPTGLV